MQFLKDNILLFIVFFTGACVLIIELVALRMLSAYFGGTLYSSTSVITVVLAALSLGYYAGGRFSDSHPDEKYFYGLVTLGGLSTLILYFVSQVTLPFVNTKLSIMYGPLVMAVVLFLIPSFFLGMLSPYAITLMSKKVTKSKIGSVSGNVFFASTLGSIVGSMLTGFYLIPRFGVDRIMITVSSLLLAVGVSGLISLGVRQKLFTIVVIIFSIFFSLSVFLPNLIRATGLIYEEDGVYENMQIFDIEYEGEPARILFLDTSASSAINRETGGPVFDYAKFFKLHKVLDLDINRALVLGAGAYTLPNFLVQSDPDVVVDGVDIEPSLYDLGKEYFGVEDSDRINPIVTDGRVYMEQTNEMYDYVYLDVFSSSFTPPPHLFTKEFFEALDDNLNDDAVVIINTIGSFKDDTPSISLSQMKTFNSVFDRTFYFTTKTDDIDEHQNYIFVAVKGDKEFDWDSVEGEYFDYMKSNLIEREFDLSDHIVFTDNYAPIEWMGAKMVLEAN